MRTAKERNIQTGGVRRCLAALTERLQAQHEVAIMISSVRNAPGFRFFAPIKVILQEISNGNAKTRKGEFDKFVSTQTSLLFLLPN